MPEPAKPGYSCVTPARGPIAADAESPAPEAQAVPEEKKTVQARVGKPAPDFEAVAYQDGSFKTVKLSDYKGQWTILCFYPGDFTFV
jgi:hypothetical protein